MLWCIIFQVAVLSGMPISQLVLHRLDLHFDAVLRS